MGVGKPAWSGWGQVGDDPAWRCASAHHPRATPHHRSVGSLLQAAPNSGHAGKAHRSDPLPPSTCRALWSTDPAIENGRCPHRWVLKARRLGGSEAPKLGSEDGVMPTDATPGKATTRRDSPERRPLQCGWFDPACGVGDRARDGAAGLTWVRRKELPALPPPRPPDSATGSSPLHSCPTGCMVNS